GISYVYIIAIAAIPAIMYFLSVGFFVHIEALKAGIRPLSPEEIPKLGPVLKKGIQFLVPLFLLIILLVSGYTPTYAACWGILSIVAMSWVRKDSRMYPKDILDALYLGARNTVSTASILICAGIIVGVAAITALAITFSGVILALSHGILFIAIGLVAFASLILGMGLPVTASYIMLAVLAGPALKQLGLPLIVAHMIIFWYSQDANVTPPVCLAAYSASGVAGSNPMRTGFVSWKLAKGLYIIPFLFAYTPLLFTGPVKEVIITAVFATLGLLSFTVLLEGYFLRKTIILERILVGIATAGLLWPTFIPRMIGLLILVSVFISQKLIRQAPVVAK
ncbi:MAG: TRAP transporter fused permease subunit, partial [Candidatus Aerophobetes bacterium]|nr:TRAP transporter fused permease subunit [Candidatus Aerophobetes bacterium]